MTDHRVSPLKKADLQYNYPPSSTLGDDPRFRAIPDSILLNRREWYEVLYFVNKFANERGKGDLAVAKKTERLIHMHLPSDQRSQVHVSEWLVTNWSTYGDAPIA